MSKMERWCRNVLATWRLSKQFVPTIYRLVREARPARGDVILCSGFIEVFPKLADGIESL